MTNHKNQILIDRFVLWSMCWSLVASEVRPYMAEQWWRWQVELMQLFISLRIWAYLFPILQTSISSSASNFSFCQPTNHKTIRFACIIIVPPTYTHTHIYIAIRLLTPENGTTGKKFEIVRRTQNMWESVHVSNGPESDESPITKRIDAFRCVKLIQYL